MPRPDDYRGNMAGSSSQGVTPHTCRTQTGPQARRLGAVHDDRLTHSYSYGGGVQSTAIPPGPFLFANVGDDSEHPATLDYVRGPAWDFAAAHGVDVHELHRIPKKGRSKGEVETLWGRLMRDGSRSLPIPVRMSNGAPGTRSCTADFKIRVVSRWLIEHGATAEHPVRVGIGISTDEYQRANNRKRHLAGTIMEDEGYRCGDVCDT